MQQVFSQKSASPLRDYPPADPLPVSWLLVIIPGVLLRSYHTLSNLERYGFRVFYVRVLLQSAIPLIIARVFVTGGVCFNLFFIFIFFILKVFFRHVVARVSGAIGEIRRILYLRFRF